MTQQDWVTQAMKKVSDPKPQKKETQKVRNLNLLVIIVERRDIHLMFAGARKQMIIQRQFMAYCQKCKKQGHQTQEYWRKFKRTSKFEGHYYNCQKYGHRAFECRSKTTWTPNKVRSHNWDYNTRYSCHYYQGYGHIPENCIRKHFRGNHSRWLNETTCFSCHKTGHV